jgi:hypothetical protein
MPLTARSITLIATTNAGTNDGGKFTYTSAIHGFKMLQE